MTIGGRAWLALCLPAIAWFGFEQGLSALLHADCRRSGVGLVWGVASLALCGLAARTGWRLRGQSDALVHRWLARLALVAAAFFGLAIAFQTLALLLVPACLR